MPVRRRGKGENYKPSVERAIVSTRPWPSSLAPFRGPPPLASVTQAISCPPHWWRSADIARAYLLKGLPWRLAVVARQSWSQKEREEGESSIYCREKKRKKGRVQTWASLPLSCERLPASALRRELYPFLSLCLRGWRVHAGPHVSHTPRGPSSLMSTGWSRRRVARTPREGTLKSRPACWSSCGWMRGRCGLQ